MTCSRSVNCRCPKKSNASFIVNCVTSLIFLSPTVIANTSGFRRAPWQVVQGLMDINFSNSSRIESVEASL